VDQTLSRTTDERGATRSANLRRGQQKERDQLQADIAKAQVSITRLNEERAPLAAELRKVEAEVGPIRYIAALVYGDNPDANILERAVRWVIILIVVVFDPLALCLILAGNRELAWAREAKQQVPVTVPEEPIPAPEPEPSYAPDDGPLTDNQIKQIKIRSNRPRTYRATTKKTTPTQVDMPAVEPGEFVGVPAEPDPDALLEKSKAAVKVTMPTFN
jgi:hypothetical protein